MKTLFLALATFTFSSPACFAKESKTQQTQNAISDAWANTKKLVSKKKKENCREGNGHTDCSRGAEKLKKSAKKASDAATE